MGSTASARQSNGGGGIGGVAAGQPTRAAAAGRKKNRDQKDSGLTGKGKGKGPGTGTGTGTGTGMRDTFLSQFHALGKLLYAKRSPPDDSTDAVSSAAARAAEGWPAMTAVGGGGDMEGRRGQLEFVPEEVLSRGGMELDWALAFLQYHCVDFFTDESGELFLCFFLVFGEFVFSVAKVQYVGGFRTGKVPGPRQRPAVEQEHLKGCWLFLSRGAWSRQRNVGAGRTCMRHLNVPAFSLSAIV